MFTASPRNWRCDIPVTRKLPMTKSRNAPSTSWDTSIPTDKVQVKVEGGWITLSGQVEWYYQKVSAESAVRRISGVKGVSNMATIKPRVQPSDVKGRIESALKRKAG